ncbi:FxLYD domain-containing protein [Paenibacillus sp. NPDC058071]|uniref:FxLYD domain-containing protein n=1 Tax=Paenibacillus sp. NPDC058071 TaxID=3346326 RepID=UPI0036D83387
MYCFHCKKEHANDAVYCSKCGKLLETRGSGRSVPDEEAAAVELQAAGEQLAAAIETGRSRKKTAGGSAITIWLIPLCIFVISAGAVFSYYLYESNRNERVLQHQEQAKSEALAGRYEQAAQLLDDALHLRPSYTAAQADLSIVNEAISFKRSIAAIEKKLENKRVNEALQLFDQLRQQMRGREEPLFASLREQYDELSVRVIVEQTSAELDQLLTIEELGLKYNAIRSLNGDIASALQKKIEDKLAGLTTQETEALLKKKNFSEALAVVQQGMSYVTGNEQLLKLYDRVQKEKTKFEQAEQQRIANAMQKAAEEDLINQTAAVEVVKIETKLGESGELHINGEMKNAATRPIYSVTIEYTVHDANGDAIESGTAEAKPSYIEAGENFHFEGVIQGVEDENVKVVIDHATWYLD